MLSTGRSPCKAKTVRFLPAFLISHKYRLRRADICASFPPGEAKSALRALSPRRGDYYPKTLLPQKENLGKTMSFPGFWFFSN